MQDATLLLLINNKKEEVLLGMKKIGFGSGKYNAFGGKVEENEDIKDAAIRELLEESGIKVLPEHTEKFGEIDFFFENKGEWDQKVHVFVSERWEGEPTESNEMIPKWFSFKEIPFKKMWADDVHWLPLVLNKKKIKAEFVFPKDDETKILEMKLEEI